MARGRRMVRIALGVIGVSVAFTVIGLGAFQAAARQAAQRKALVHAAEARWGTDTWRGVEESLWVDVWRLNRGEPPSDWEHRAPETESLHRGQRVRPKSVWAIRLRNALMKLDDPRELAKHASPGEETCVPHPDAVVHFKGAHPEVDLLVDFSCRSISLAPLGQAHWTATPTLTPELVKLLHEIFPDDAPLRAEWEKNRWK